jgi:hypothetical protein
MLRPISTSSASASSAPAPVHASAAAVLSTGQTRAATIAAAEPVRASQVSGNQTFVYNSFEFVYRQEIGRIVLVGQSPETGERVVQVPSEQALRAYAHTAHVQRQMDRIQSKRASSTPEPTAQPAPQLAKALVAAVSGENHGSAVVSVSA